MSDFRYVAVQFLRAKTLVQITELARRSYKGFSQDEIDALIAISRVVTREIIAKHQEERRKGAYDETGKTNARTD